MKVTIEKTFDVDGSAANAWTLLKDIPKVAECMPGAEIIGETSPGSFDGKVKAKVGPAMMAFNGNVVLEGIDDEKREMKMVGKGQDVKGTSSAEMSLTAYLVETEPGKCQLIGSADVSVTGKVASLGGRMLTQVADQILGQFGKRFQASVVAMGEGEEAEAAKEVLKEEPKELNGLAFAWSVFIGFIKSLFGGSKPKAEAKAIEPKQSPAE